MVPENASQFSIALQRGADTELADIHLHLLAQQLRGAAVVVRNARLHGSYGVEEQLPSPFPLYPRPFLLVLTAYADSYEVEVNGSSNLSFKVRDGLPISTVTHLAIQAELSVWAIHIPVENMPRNLRLSLGEGVKVGDMFSIRGQPAEEANSFVINWQSGPAKFDDVLFQLNPRLPEGKVVCNSRLDEEMGQEEVTKETPFSPGAPFQLDVGVSTLGFESRLDGKEWRVFKHRHEVEAAKTLFLEGDLQPTNICIDSAQVTLPGIINGTNPRSRRVRLQHICPDLPLTSRVTGGFEKGCLMLISGKVHSNPKNFQVTVQCGEGSEDIDIALNYLVQWEVDGSPKITLNSREEDTWGQEVRANVEEGFHPSLQFDLAVAYTEDGFRCFLSGLEHSLFLYRLEDLKPDHVTVSGDVAVQRLMLL